MSTTAEIINTLLYNDRSSDNGMRSDEFDLAIFNGDISNTFFVSLNVSYAQILTHEKDKTYAT